MASSLYNISNYSRFNLTDTESDITVFVREYKHRIKKQFLADEDPTLRTRFKSFNERKLTFSDVNWLLENDKKFFQNTPNENVLNLNYLSEFGFLFCMEYSPDGEYIIVGHSTGLIQKRDRFSWVEENYNKYLKGTPNEIRYNRWYLSELGAITASEYSPNGAHIVVGHASGMIQMRHGTAGTVLCTLRNIQFPPKAIYSIQYSPFEERVCYAACMDGCVYRIEIPNITPAVDPPPEHCIRVDPALECLTTQFYGTPSSTNYTSPFITNRSPALGCGVTADGLKMVVGYADTSIKLVDMETQEVDMTYKVHRLRLQFIPKKLQRLHTGQVCAVRCHPEKQFMFASGAWDNTLRIWDTRCSVGCVMTFEGVDICSDSIDLNRDECISGSWAPTEALSVWDLKAKKRLNIIRVQNRRPDVDGEYIYACRYWRSSEYNRKGKYAVIGGSGTQCVEVINLHNRYISCSYPAEGTVLAVTSHNDRIAFGGTAPLFNIVTFHDPKHEKYDKDKWETSEPIEQGVYDVKEFMSYSISKETSDDNVDG